MKKEELITNIAGVLGVSEKETTLAFDIFLQKVSETLDVDESLRVPGLGIFQLNRKTGDAREKGVYDRSLCINFIPVSTSTKLSEPEVISFPVSKKLNDSGFDENVFSLSIDKPLIPVSGRKKEEYLVQSSYLMLQRKIEDTVDELIEKAARMNDFKLDSHGEEGIITSPEDLMSDDIELADIPWNFGEEELQSDEEIQVEDEIENEEEEVHFEQETDDLDEKLDLLVEMDTDDVSYNIGLDELSDESFVDEELDFSQILENEVLNLEDEEDYALNSEVVDDFPAEPEIPLMEEEIPEADDTEDFIEEPQRQEEPDEFPFVTEEETTQEELTVEEPAVEDELIEDHNIDETITDEIPAEENAADEPVADEAIADETAADEITADEDVSEAEHSIPIADDVSLLEPGESRKKEGSPVFWLILASFMLVTVAGAYYFLFMSKKTKHSNTAAETKIESKEEKYSAAYEVNTEVIERKDDIPVTPVIEAPAEEEQSKPETRIPEKKNNEDKKITENKTPETKVPETKVPENKVSESKTPVTKVPETKVSEKKTAEVKKPDQNKPEIKKSEVKKVEINKPDESSKKTVETPKSDSRQNVAVKQNNAAAKQNNTPVKQSNVPSKQENAAVRQKEVPKDIPEENISKYVRSDSKDKMVRPYIFTDGNRFTIQKSSWQKGSKAAAEVSKYRRLGFDSYIVKYSPRNETPWYRVRVGDFSTITEAEAVLKRLP